jgi:AcrR family transcriptional regulator
MPKPVKRRYDNSARRAQAQTTRERICVAAEKLFLRDGYVRTSIRAVAAEADVSEATVYVAFSSKATLLDATIIRATRDNDGEPLSAVLEAPPPDILGRLASSHAATLKRAGRLIALGESAALMDADLEPMRARAHNNLKAMYANVAERLRSTGLLRDGMSAADAASTLFALCNEVTYLRITDGGASAGHYARWLTNVLEATLVERDQPGTSPGATRPIS